MECHSDDNVLLLTELLTYDILQGQARFILFHLLQKSSQGPYKQYMGRSKMTGNLTLVLYEDPEDGIPKIHVRSSRYMAWIAEMMLPSHLHVEKVDNKTKYFRLRQLLL